MALDAYLELLNGGKAAVSGEALDEDFRKKKAMALLSFQVESQVDLNSAGDGHTDEGGFFIFTISKLLDIASPELFKGLHDYWSTRKSTWEKARVTVRRSMGGSPRAYLVYEFFDVWIKKWDLDLDESGDTLPKEKIDFVCSGLDITYTPSDNTGKPLSPINTQWKFGGQNT